MLRPVSGKLGPSFAVQPSAGNHAAGFPRLLSTERGVLLAWAEAGATNRVRTALWGTDVAGQVLARSSAAHGKATEAHRP